MLVQPTCNAQFHNNKKRLILNKVNIRAVSLIVGVCIAGVSCQAQSGFAVASKNDSTKTVFPENKFSDKPAFLSKKKAMALEDKSKVDVRIAYDLTHGDYNTLDQVPARAYFYYDPYQQVLSAASSSKDAVDLAAFEPAVFYAQRGEALSSTLVRWAHDAGYQLKWMTNHDYKIQYSYAFHGGLVNSDGAMNQLLESFEHNTYALKAEVTANKVILIKENTYNPSVVSGI
jgi:hypothetical protein